jgi:glycogen operon protein
VSDGLLALVKGEFALRRGHPLPLGASVRRDGLNFAVFSAHATWVRLVLFLPGGAESVVEIPLDARDNRTGDVWHVLVAGLDPGVEYGWRAGREGDDDAHLHRFEPERVLLDPYARAVVGAPRWGEGALPLRGEGDSLVRPRRARVIDDEFDWGHDAPLNRHLADSIIYELHVRGYTAHPSSGVAHPGTYRGLVDKIAYLKDLGVTAVELLPVTEFDETDCRRVNPFTGERLLNLWGYQPLAFFAPKPAYAASGAEGGELREFREMVKAFHAAGIEVILDMVFNHTGEGPLEDPPVSWRGLDNASYYMHDPRTGKYLDFTGCGNTLNCNHPVPHGMIMSALRYWVTEMHVDGFRFDLASVLGRGRDGAVLQNPPLLEMIAGDAVLAHTKLIAEAWDAAGLYQVGEFPSWGRWAEWNGRFRDDVRRFVRGDEGTVPLLATRLAGSADLYEGDGRGPYHSVNFVTSHDGFTLRDLVSHERRHNEMNGEGNRDGHAGEISWNGGVEGPSADAEIVARRVTQAKSLAAILLLSQGVPMILGGDELGRTQRGNNNAYCQDNDVAWVDWRTAESNAELLRFFRQLVRFRLAHAALRRRSFTLGDLPGPWVAWQGERRDVPDWSASARLLGMHLRSYGRAAELFVMCSARAEPARVELPLLPAGVQWRRAVDTSRAAPDDALDVGAEPVAASQSHYLLAPHAVAVLVGR